MIAAHGQRARGWLAVGMVALAALSGGCATPPNPADMTAIPTVARQHPQTVSVAYSSMADTPMAPESTTSQAAISDAIVSSIDKTRLFSQVVTAGKSQFVLSVVLVTMDTPLFGVSFTAKCEMGWTLARADGTKVWQEMVRSEGTATGGEAFAGVTRVRMARERAVRENVSQALTKLGQLDL